MSELYERDFHAWTSEQSHLLREGRADEADLAHIAEEIEDMGRSRRTELRNRLAVLLLHLLKWQYQATLRSRSWQSTIAEQRVRIADHLDENPSLRPGLADAVATGYRYALLRVDWETGLPSERFPATCPYAEAEVLDPGFMPGAL